MTDNSVGDLIAPEYVRDVISEFMIAQLTSISRCARSSTSRSPVVLCVVKNEMDRLSDFLKHYRDGGIERFLFIDNGSSDGTALFLRNQPDIDLYQILTPFVWTRKQGWINLAIALIGRNPDSWYIYVDADEHIVYDGYPNRTFEDLVKWADGLELRRIRGMLVDMYAEGPLLRSNYSEGERLLEAYPFFDRNGYVEYKFKEIISRQGGPRMRAFGKADCNFRPEMTKYPLFKLDGNEVFANPHHIWPYKENFHSLCYLGILHYKFLPNMMERIMDIIENNNYWNNSIEYNCYQKILQSNPELSLFCSESQRYQGPSSLISAGHICRIHMAGC